MYKRTLVLTLIFLAVALLSLVAIQALVFFAILGLGLCAYATYKGKPRDSFTLLSGLVFLSTPLAMFLLGLAVKAWLLGLSAAT
ncbi:hypothetical protein A9Q89_10240 [Gammaproteobacteria bacterium 53_120_T64]|nr:hypothetical protein A9Q89_10240 [Gammaproteobacteria bacterium 53_120_T64]